jgi:hypothetical protein
MESRKLLLPSNPLNNRIMVQISEKAAKLFSECKFKPVRPPQEEIVKEAKAVWGEEETELAIEVMIRWFTKYNYNNPERMASEYLFRNTELTKLERELQTL